MLQDLARLVEAENIDACGLLTEQAQVSYMHKCQIAIDGDALHLARDAAGLLQKGHDAVDPVGHQRIVLDVRTGYERWIQLGPPLIEDLVVNNMEGALDVVSR